MSETVGTLSATTKATETLTHFTGEIEGLVFKPITPAANGTVLAKASALGAPWSLWPGMGATTLAPIKGLLIGKPLAGGMAVAVMGGGGSATIVPAALTGLAASAALMVPLLFATAAIGVATAAIGKMGRRRQGKSWLVSLLPFRAIGAKPRTDARQKVETARNIVSKQNKEMSFEFDRRFALRIKVPPGEMIVYSTDTKGQRIKGRAVDISMHGVKFRSQKATVRSIELVIFPRYNVILKVKSASIHRQVGNDAVAVIDSFENDADSSMRWIELMTRLDRKG